MYLTILYITFLPFVEAAAKTLGAHHSPIEIAGARFMFQFFILGVILLFGLDRQAEFPRPFWPVILRACFLIVGSVFIYAALALMVMAEISAMFFIQPLIVSLFAVGMLKERLDIWGCLIIGTGLLGACIVAAPNLGKVGWSTFLPIGAACCFAASAALTRRFAMLATPVVFQFVTAAVAMLLLPLWFLGIQPDGSPALDWSLPSGNNLVLFSIVGIGTTVTNLMITQAYRVTPLLVVAPLLYFEIITAGIIGYLIFDDLPHPESYLGALLIIVAGISNLFRKTQGYDGKIK